MACQRYLLFVSLFGVSICSFVFFFTIFCFDETVVSGCLFRGFCRPIVLVARLAVAGPGSIRARA